MTEPNDEPRPAPQLERRTKPQNPAAEAPPEGSSRERGAGLSADDQNLLDLEAHTYRSVGAKERDIRHRLGLTPVDYHLRLTQLLDNPAAIAYAPAVIRRARRRAGR